MQIEGKTTAYGDTPIGAVGDSLKTIAAGAGGVAPDVQTAGADAESNTANSLRVAGRGSIFNGATWDRIRSAVGDALAATGLLAVGQMLWNGATWDRAKGDNTGAARVSLYGKNAVAGDTPFNVNLGGHLPITFGGEVAVGDATSNALVISVTTMAEAVRAMLIGAFGFAFNGVTWDRNRNNHEATALASAARTASVNSADLVNYNARGVVVVIDVTAIAATPSVVFTITGKDTLSGKYVDLLVSAAITAVGTTRLTIYPGVTVAANLALSAPLPRIWRVQAVNNDADSITYSVGANYIN